MTTPEPTTAAPDGQAAQVRGDVRSARSRMRTKYGSQRQIQEVAELLGTDETLRFMAVASGPSQPDRHNHGLVALTDERLIFVPTASTHERVITDMTTVGALLWTKSARTGVLTVMGPDH